MKHVIQIVPNYPPTVCGVGDHAHAMATQLQKAGMSFSTICATTHENHADTVQSLKERSSTALLSALDAVQGDTVVLHYSPYGYGKHGYCAWLAEGLQTWKQKAPNRRVLTLFHEVFASGPIWRRSFWTARTQKQVAGAIADMSDVKWVTSEKGRGRLQTLHHSSNIDILPTFSNIGEPAKVPDFNSRAKIAVVFGSAGRKNLFYMGSKSYAAELQTAFDKADIQTIFDIGSDPDGPNELAGRAVDYKGRLPAKELSDILLTARMGLVNYPTQAMTKSGIVAAYTAHGVPVVNIGSTVEKIDKMRPGVLSIPALRHPTLDFTALSVAGHQFYETHNIETTAQKLAHAINTTFENDLAI